MSEEGGDESQGYVPSAQKEQREVESPFLVMENIVDKLKILDYDNGFLKQKTVAALNKGLTHTYFALPHSNPNEQYFYFTSLVSWIMGLAGNDWRAPGQFDDPNATSAQIIEELKKMGIPTDFAPSKLKEGWGETVCMVLNMLLDHVMQKKGFKFGTPIHLQQTGVDHVAEEEDDDEEEIMVADETIVDDEEVEEQLDDYEEPREEGTALIESNVDAAEWLLEVERVAPFLKIPKAGDQKDWRSHFEKMKVHHKAIQENLPGTKEAISKMLQEIKATVEAIETREKYINEQFTALIEEYKTASEQREETKAKYTEASEKVNELTQELQNLVDDLENVKQQMEVAGSSLIDTAPLVKLKNAMKKLNEEIGQFEIRIGVVEHILFKAKANAKKQGPMFQMT